MIIRTFKLLLAFLLYLTFSTGFTQGQQYPIPGASQQATWVFPMFFEDALGNKDTIYLGYDGNYANNFGCYHDGYFGEQNVYYYAFDTNYNVFTCWEPYIGGHDSISKVNILSDLSILFTVFVNNAKYPLKIKWDSSLLWSDSIPFPSVSGLPKAEALLDWYFGTNLPTNSSCFFSNILITDTCNYYCCASDSILFIDTDNTPGPIDSYFTISFRPWSGIIVGEEEVFENFVFRIEPNLLNRNDEIKIQSTRHITQLRIFSVTGELKSEQKIRDNIFNVKNLTSGIYFIQGFEGNHFIGITKVIIL